MTKEQYDARNIFIYVVLAGPFFKIGWSLNPEKRIDDFKGQAYRPELLGYVWGHQPDEAYIHGLLIERHLQMRGEWFHVDVASIRLVAWILGNHSKKVNTLTESLRAFRWSAVGL